MLDERLVRATGTQVPELLEWAKRLDGGERVWAIESAGGLGYLLAQQLLAAGEQVVDIPATLASRVRLLGTGRSEKNDPNDARSVAIAALRAAELVPVRVEDHATVLRLLAGRHTQLGWAYNKTACRLHAVVADLVPGGIGQELVVSQARSLLDEHQPVGAVAIERHALAVEMLDELDRLNTQRQTLRRRICVAVAASGTTLTEIFGIGDVGAAVILGQVGDVARFRDRGPLRRLQRHRPDRMVLREPEAADPSALTPREPHPEPRHPHRRGHPAPPPPQPRPCVL